MKSIKRNYTVKILRTTLLLIVLSFLLGASNSSVDKNNTKSISKTQETGEVFVFNINNIYLPIDNKGIIAAVDPGDGIGPGGMFDGNTLLFSAGFYMSGYANGELFGNGVLSASRIEDYRPGPVGSHVTDPKNRIYTVALQDRPFTSYAWQNWKDAVSLGADFYDGDGDGIYNPVDLNGNGTWDEGEDRPDMLGDLTAWCVYNDGISDTLRRFSDNPLGIEIQQTVFGLQTKTIAGNLMFIRYRIKNSGLVADTLKEVYFGVAADPDLGDHQDDLVGSDIDLSAGYVYNKTVDAKYGPDCPSFLMNFLQGPIVYTPNETFTDVDADGKYTEGVDVAIDTAFATKGTPIRSDVYPGAKNLPLTSMTHYMSSNPTMGDPNNVNELRNYMLGGKKTNGDSIYVSNWQYGNSATLGADTSNIPSHFMYSGNPETQTGWLNTSPNDQRQINNTGPFNLVKDEYQDIYVAYVVGRGTTSLNSVTEAKKNAYSAIGYYNTNFKYVPVGVKEKPQTELPTKFSLSQNYPNPFNPSTTIKYSIPISATLNTTITSVSLKIHDILGREVATLVNKEQKAGSYEVTFDASASSVKTSSLTSGIYFYRLQSGSFNESRKMILLK